MLELTLEEKGAYNTVLDLIYLKSGQLRDDEKFIVRWLGRTNVRAWRRIRRSLIAKSKLAIVDGFIRNRTADIVMGKPEFDESLANVSDMFGESFPNHIGNSKAIAAKNNDLRTLDKRREKTELRSKKESKRRASRLPANFVPDCEYAAGKGMTQATYRHQASQFASHHSSTGRLYVRWDRVWHTWVGKWIEYGSQQIGGKTHGQQRPNGSRPPSSGSGATAAAASATADFIANLEQAREPDGGDGAGQTLEHHDDEADR